MSVTFEAVVVDYGVGNLHSVLKALAHEGGDAVLSADPAVIAAAPRLILPGVGAFGDGMRELERRGVIGAIRELHASGRPLLGICLGMQMLLGESTEFGLHAGLGLIPGRVERIEVAEGWKVPHVGWRALEPGARGWAGSILAELEAPMMYFVHSFHARPLDGGDVLATVRYGEADVTAAVQRDNAIGVQFHPEKSGPVGLRLIHRFLRS